MQGNGERRAASAHHRDCNADHSPDFNRFLATDTVQGAFEAILEMFAEIPTDNDGSGIRAREFRQY